MRVRAKFHKFSGAGFTLVETVIAVGIVATLLVTILGILGLSTETLRETIGAREADRLVTTLERELSILRESEIDPDTRSAFDKAYQWIDKSSRGNAVKVLLYNFEGDPNTSGDDGNPKPIGSAGEGSGDVILTSVARFIEDSTLPEEIKEELGAVVGPVFFVRTTQLVYRNGALTRGDPGIIPPHEGQAPLTGGTTPADSYPEAVIAFEADFYLLPSNTEDYIAGFTFEDLGRPLFTRTMAVRR